MLLLKRLYQKVLYLRGGGRTLCTKSHLVGLVPELAAAYPDARFVTSLRAAPAQLSSFWGLQCAISRDLGLVARAASPAARHAGCARGCSGVAGCDRGRASLFPPRISGFDGAGIPADAA